MLRPGCGTHPPQTTMFGTRFDKVLIVNPTAIGVPYASHGFSDLAASIVACCETVYFPPNVVPHSIQVGSGTQPAHISVHSANSHNQAQRLDLERQSLPFWLPTIIGDSLPYCLFLNSSLRPPCAYHPRVVSTPNPPRHEH
jgi:hypothetical protein